MQNKLKQCPFCGGEKEFIEREALLARYDAEHVGSPGRARELIVTAPAADVMEVRHGRWEKHGIKWQCTGCKVLMSIDGTPQENMLYYCPQRGAKMDKEKEPLYKLAKEIHENAVTHGWWDEERNLLEIVALCHSELSEAVEEYRAGRDMIYPGVGGKPEGIAVEMADCLIRILDWFGHEGLDVDGVVREKMLYNKGRPYKHGKKC